MNRAIVAGSVIVTALAGILVIYASNGPSSPPSVVTGGADRSVTLPAHVVMPNSIPSQAASSQFGPPRAARSSPSIKLLAELVTAKDWRAFALSARSRPDEGGYFYAMHVANVCGMGVAAMPQLAGKAVSDTVAKSSTVSATQMSMVDKLMSRCASFAPNEAADIFQSTKSASTDNRDPIVNALVSLSTALAKKDAQLSKEALRALLELGDPVAPYKDELLVRVMSRSKETGKPGDLWFDGTLYGIDDPDKVSALRLAISLAACRGQIPCDIDTDLMLACLGGQICVGTPDDYLHQRYVKQGGMTEEQYAHAVALSTRIRQVVTSVAVEALIP